MAAKNTLFAASYERVSTDEQAREGFSLEAQSDANKRIIVSEGWNYYGSFIDPGVSGKDLKRKGVQSLLKAINDGHVQVVVVHKLDRLTRSIGDLHYLINYFEERNIKLVSVSEKLDTSTAMGRMFVFMLGIFAQWYRENLAEEVKKGMSKRAEKGFHNVTVPMYGYSRDEEGNLHIIEEEAKWVRWIFDQYIQGIGTSTIARQLNHKGIRRNQGALWDQHKVAITLNNLHYIGKVHWKDGNLPEDKRIIREGKHTPIISEDIYNQAQHILERRREGLISQNSYEYVFGGIVKCGKCGGGYKGKYTTRKLQDGSQALYRAYACSNNIRYGSCDAPGISELILAKLLFASMDFFVSPSFKQSYEPHVEDSEEREELERLIALSETKRSRWQHAYGEDLMSFEDFATRMKEENEKLEQWKQQLNAVAPNRTSTFSIEESLETLKMIKENWEYFEQPDRKIVIQALFQKITIMKENGKWKIIDAITV